MLKLKKNKTIIIGGYGTGKSCMALDLVLKTKGTSIICNGWGDKSYYEKNFPFLKEYESKDGSRNFVAEKGKKYFICAKDCRAACDAVDALIYGCDYGELRNDKKSIVVFDDGAWERSENEFLDLWRLSHVDCGVIITANTIYDILKLNRIKVTEKMMKDISKHWNIINLDRNQNDK